MRKSLLIKWKDGRLVNYQDVDVIENVYHVKVKSYENKTETIIPLRHILYAEILEENE